MKNISVLWVLIVSLLMLKLSASEAPPPEPTPIPCSSDEYRQFDFWIGDWEVFDIDNKKVGENRIVKILAGCALQENWTGVSKNRGHSYNIYDTSTASWHQTWVDNSGTLLQLDGGLKDGAMVLEGESYTPQGPLLNRISWTAKDDAVLQVWSLSTDRGKTWRAIFHGLYKKKVKKK
ncbi:hypothetical protein [Kangiella sp. TOML190]|uniref:hypothetical protein n=1 Tax=Kangiella sp. TOML190 TaxID=2931351 RepID=UPI00203CA285|nr:hypothetical protein [Kangiella sp. TOML190]